MMKSKIGTQMKELVQTIGELAAHRQQLAYQAGKQYAPEVNDILRKQDRDQQRIERLLDVMLDFCFDDAILCLYKKLCRYYFTINPEATVSYVNAYRGMWEEGET